MGVVYHGHDDDLDRPVAIKTVLEALADEHARKRFRREAQIAARAHHPNICEIYEIGQYGELPYIVMELLEGETLATRIGRGPLGVSEAIRVGMEILTALGALHAHGLLHRDLKPSNVFLTEHGVKLLDFGLAKPVTSELAQPHSPTASQLTQAGAVLGTPHYMAPEQIRGETVDERADLFALGAVLFEMLTGVRAFRGRSSVEILFATLNEEPLAIGGSPEAVTIDRIVRRALCKRAEERYQSASELKRALEKALPKGNPSEALRVFAIARLMILPFRPLRADPDTDFLGPAIADAIASALSSLPSVVVRSSAMASRFAGEVPDLKRLAHEAEVDVVLMGTLLRAENQIRVHAELTEVPSGTMLWSYTPQVTMRDVFQLQDEIVERIVDSLAVSLTAREHRNLKRDVPASPSAYELYLRGNKILLEGLSGGAHLEVARDLYKRCVSEDPRYAPAWARLGRSYWLIAKGSGDKASGEQADASFRRAIELNPELPLAHHLYAYVEADLGRAQEAMVRLLHRAATGAAQPELYAALVHVCRYTGQLEASAAAHERARRLDSQISTSANHTYWQLGELERSRREMGRGTILLDAFILVESGRVEQAIALLKEREGAALSVTRVHLASLRTLLEGKNAESLEATEATLAGYPDPEARFWLAAQFARLGESRRALDTLREVLARGYIFHRAVDRHPWFSTLRSEPEFTELRQLAEVRYGEALQAYVAAEGAAVLGVSASPTD